MFAGSICSLLRGDLDNKPWTPARCSQKVLALIVHSATWCQQPTWILRVCCFTKMRKHVVPVLRCSGRKVLDALGAVGPPQQ